MARINRPTFLALCDLELGQLRTLDRRGQLPFAIDQSAGRGYEAGEVFLTLVAQHLAATNGAGLNVTRAADIAAALPAALSAAWADIVETGRILAGGTNTPPDEILAGRADAADTQPRAVAGTLSNIAAELQADGFVTQGLTVVSASTLMAQLIERANKHDIELPAEFWTGPLRYRPRPAALTPEEMAIAAMEVK